MNCLTCKLKEACGVVGIFSSDQVSRPIYKGLLTLQHRGQESSGISTFDGTKIHVKKSMGLVSDGLTENSLSTLTGNMGIGHVRYSTMGNSSIEDAQPFIINYPKHGIALGFNGNVVNFVDLKRQLSQCGRLLQTTADAELVANSVAEELMATKDIENAIYNVMNKIEGSYCVTMLTGDGELIAFRDPLGFRPLVFGENEKMKMFASETPALDVNNIEKFSDIKPGEVVVIKENDAVERKQIMPCNQKAYCMFEYVYFSRPDSVINGKSVYETRIKLGQNLAKTYNADADVIVPVPDTARPAAEGIARETGVPVVEGLIKNRYVWRTFIMPRQRTRENFVSLKLNPVRSVLKDKRVILVDDSIVRGTTSRMIVDLVRKAGAKKVDFWVSCPPIISPCFYGIDMSTHAELIAANKNVQEIAKTIHADSLHYQTIDGLVDAIGFSNELCNACLTGRYPTPIAQNLADRLKTQQTLKRYYEVE